eukprot:TRINITY_DN76312_c0_g1_i1.p1 TRINITY_DN76312_c0_g1~~TRINITY_DN76312_c0_g1_i1.p1  ORF type:complete len:874 (-),score=174.89 TRINITY_DN76312_c0_g1_i1:81-2648(-)
MEVALADEGLLPDRPAGNTKNQLSTLNGCYIPCLLNILGAVLFLRVGFAVGMMGLWGALGIFAFSELIAYLTITSFSAIVTNGRMAGGGAYYMISRNLGPAFGGSSGIMFWFTYCLNVTFNTVSFTGVFQETFFSKDSWWGNPDNYSQEVISTITLFILFLVGYKGAGAFAKINGLIFVGLVIALLASIGSLFFSTREIELDPVVNAGQNHSGHFSPWNFETLKDNMYPEPVASDECAQAAMFGSSAKTGTICNLQLVFSVVFPAVVGMMEGANLSGDLKDPGRSIPLGTLAAVSTAFFCYVLLIVGQAGTVDRNMLQYDMNVMQHSSVGSGYFVVMGVATACLSTALGSMFGSARILQAIARDDIFPGLGIFKYGSPQGDEPRYALILSYLVAEIGILLGGLDDVAPVLTNFFLLAYFLVNLACFLLIVSRVPNFRPTFRFYSWPTSLSASVLIIVVMFYLQWFYAVVTLLVVTILYSFLALRFRRRSDWIDISQAVLFRWARHGLLSMQTQRVDAKYWRPSILLLLRAGQVTQDAGIMCLLRFLNRAKESGLFVIGQAHIGEPEGEIRTSSQIYSELSTALPGLQGFPQLTIAPSGQLACTNLLLGSGLGNMVPDTVAMMLPQSEAEFASGADSHLPVDSADELVQVMYDMTRFKKNLLLAANFHSCAREMPARVDLWIIGDMSPPLSGEDELELREKIQLSLLLQMGMICHTQGIPGTANSHPELRLVHCTAASNGERPSSVEEQAHENVLRRWLRWARIPHASVKVLRRPAGPQHFDAQSCESDFAAVNEQMRVESENAGMVITLLPALPLSAKALGAHAYWRKLCTLTEGLPPTVLLLNGQGFPVITSVI